MKLRRVVSGILACMMILGSVPASAVEPQEGTAEAQQGPHLSYIAPKEGGFAMPARVSAGEERYTEFKDRAENPVTLTNVHDNGEQKIEKLDGIWGFNGQVKSESDKDKFDVTGNTPMIIAFKLYFKKAADGENGQVILSKGERQYCISLIGNGLRFHTALSDSDYQWRNYEFNHCFTKTNQWYDVVFVKDGDEGVRFYVNDRAGELAGYRSLVHFDNDVFTIGSMINRWGSAERDLTSDCGYVADVKFYNGAAMEGEAKTAFEETVNLRKWDALEDDGIIPLYKLLESTPATADFSLRPYRTVTEWREGQASDEVVGSFKCGTEYTATTTLTVRDGEDFRFTDKMAETVKSDIQGEKTFYNKIPADQMEGTADSWGCYDDEQIKNALDGDENTFWHSSYEDWDDSPNPDLNSDPKVNNTYTITLKEPARIGKFEYVPRPGGGNGTITNLNLYYSTKAKGDEFRLIKENIEWSDDASIKEVLFDEGINKVKRIRIEVNAAHGGFISAAEFYLHERIDVNADVETGIASEGKQMTVKTSYSASHIPCNYEADAISFSNLIDMEAGKTRQLEPKVLMDDGMALDAHKGFEGESIRYTYESDTPAVAEVDANGLVTAVAEGKAKITVTAATSEQNSIEMQVDVQVFAAGSMFLHPEMKYKKPETGNYPEIAEIELNGERDDSYPTLITDVAEGAASLVPAYEGEELTVVKKDGLIAFNGQYKSTHTNNQFNVTGAKPLVILFKLWVEKLPESGQDWAIVTKGNQFSFALRWSDGAKLCLNMLGIDKNWPQAAYTIPDNWTGKWHDIVIVFDGKGTKDSMGFFIDGEFVPNETEFIGTIGDLDYISTGETTTLRPFTICGKVDEGEQVFTKESGYLAGLKFFDVTEVAPELVNEIDLSRLGNEHGAAMIKYMLDAKDRTAHITATPYKMQTTWSVTGETGALDGKTPFTAENIRDKGYTATTTLTAYGDFVFDAEEVAHIKDELRHIYVEPEIDAALLQQTAEISEDNKVLTVSVSFLPRKIQAPSITYTSPIPGGTPRRQPISNDDDAGYVMADSVWSVVGGDAMTEGETFTPITDTNQYQVQTVLTAKGDYLFDDSAEYIAQTIRNIQTQRFGNVEAAVDVKVASNGKTMTITVTYAKPIYTVTFELNGAESPASEPMQSVSSGNVPNKPDDPTRTGYKFVCWYASGDETQTAYDFTKPVAENIGLTAKWAQYLNVTFDSGVEGKPTQTITVLEGEKIKEPEEPQNGTNEFLGWYLKVGESYTAYDFDAPVTKAMTLYAQWLDKEHPTSVEVTFMDGDTELDKKSVIAGEKVTLPEEPEKDGYTFAGWFIDADCTQAFNEDTRIVSKMTLYAKWERIPAAVTGITLDPAELELEIGGAEKLTARVEPEDADNAELDWSSDDEAIASVDENGLVTAKAVGTTKIKAVLKSDPRIGGEASVTVIEPGTGKKKYTVTFDSRGGSAIAAQTVETGMAAVMPQNPTRAGYTFAGWYADETLLHAYSFNTPVSGNITLYAKWTKDAKPLANGEELTVGDFRYQVLDSNKRTLIIRKGVAAGRKILVPGTIEINGLQYTVTGIGNKAFKGNKKMTQITLPASVTSVGNQAFAGCKKLKKVIVGGTALKVGKASFKNTSAKLKISAKKMNKKQRAALLKAVKSKGKNKKAKVTK